MRVRLPSHPLLLAPPPSPAGGRSNLQAAAAEEESFRASRREEQRHVLTEENRRRSRVSAAWVRFINSFASPFVSCSLLAPNPSSPGSISAFRIPEEQTNYRQRFLRPVLRCCPRVSNFMRFPFLFYRNKPKKKELLVRGGSVRLLRFHEFRFPVYYVCSSCRGWNSCLLFMPCVGTN
jgi:hypothetical protein